MSERFSVNDSILSKPEGITSGKKQHQSMLISFFFFSFLIFSMHCDFILPRWNWVSTVILWGTGVRTFRVNNFSFDYHLSHSLNLSLCETFSTFFKQKCTWLDWRLSTNAREQNESSNHSWRFISTAGGPWEVQQRLIQWNLK